MSATVTYADCSSGDCDPAAVITQMVEERGKFSDDVSQEIQTCSNILRFAEKTKKQFPSGTGDYIKSLVFDIAQPSSRDVLDHSKRLASAAPNNSPCEVPSAVIPYGSHTVEACLMGWQWETPWFCKTDLAFKYKRERQQQQIKDIMVTWAAGIWDKWVWRSYQRSVRNWVLNANVPKQHGGSGYALANPSSILTVAWLDHITLRMRDASGLRGSPAMGAWCIMIGEEECKALFDDYFKDGAQDYGVRRNGGIAMAKHKRYDAELLGGCEYYELNNYKFFTESCAPRYRARVGNESWDDALLDDKEQIIAQNGTETVVPDGYRNPDIALYSETLIFNEEAANWLTPPAGLVEDNNFHKDNHPGYSYAGDFVPVSPPEQDDPFGKKVKYVAEFVGGYESVFPNRGAAILSLTAHIEPELKTLSSTLSPTVELATAVAVLDSCPSLPSGTLQIQTRVPLPNFADGYALFLVTAAERKVKVATSSSQYCEDSGLYLHALTFENANAGACVPRDCDQWKSIGVYVEGATVDALVDESGCAICTGYGQTDTADPVCVTYVGDNIVSVTIGATVVEGTVAATLETDVQTHLDSLGNSDVVTIVEGVAGNNYVWSVCIEGGDPAVTDFSVQAQVDGGGIDSFESLPQTNAETTGPQTVFSVADNEAEVSFVTYPGDYYDSGENTTADGTTIWTNGTTFAAHNSDDWTASVMVYYANLADAQGAANATFDSVSAGVSQIQIISTATDVGVQS